MLYRFKSKAGADVIMLADAGAQLLRLMGREPAASGVFDAAQLAAAVQALEQGVATDEADFARRCAEATAAGGAPPRREGIGLRQRAWPLLSLMRAALVGEHYVAWGV